MAAHKSWSTAAVKPNSRYTEYALAMSMAAPTVSLHPLSSNAHARLLFSLHPSVLVTPTFYLRYAYLRTISKAHRPELRSTGEPVQGRLARSETLRRR